MAGIASWELASEPTAAEVRLLWYTEGRAEADVAVVDTARFECPRSVDRREFCFRLPNGPFSFSGKLVSLRWALELAVEPSDEAERVDIAVSPTGHEVILHGDGPA